MGPYLNGGMSDSDVPAAYAAAQAAQGASGAGTPVEKALIGALGARYAPAPLPGGRRGLDSAYVAAMEQVYRRFPMDNEVGTLYADALMLLEPRRGTWYTTP